MIETTTVRELVPGDIVLAHGMRLRVENAPTRSLAHRDHHGGVFYTVARVLNREDVSNARVPFSFTEQEDGSHRWSLQGNDLFSVTREYRRTGDSDAIGEDGDAGYASQL